MKEMVKNRIRSSLGRGLDESIPWRLYRIMGEQKKELLRVYDGGACSTTLTPANIEWVLENSTDRELLDILDSQACQDYR